MATGIRACLPTWRVRSVKIRSPAWMTMPEEGNGDGAGHLQEPEDGAAGEAAAGGVRQRGYGGEV